MNNIIIEKDNLDVLYTLKPNTNLTYIATKKITHTFPNILHHCASYWGANDIPSSYYDPVGDGK